MSATDNPMAKKTTVGDIRASVLAFTAGRDHILDYNLIDVDCLGTAAHVTMLAELPHPVFTIKERDQLLAALARIAGDAQAGRFTITLEDQDVHLAVERCLTQRLGDLGKKVHTARSRNDQVAVDLRMYARKRMLDIAADTLILIRAMTDFAETWRAMPMVGRTHMQPAMPSSVGLWAFAHAESLLNDVRTVFHAYELNNQCPLGSAASYGVPLPIDRQRTSDLLGFARPCHNVLFANNARGKNESLVLAAMAQVMLTLSRLAQDLILFSMPEFNYFTMPTDYGTGSSIMPQKNNPDVLELIRARATRVQACYTTIYDIIKCSASGYNRDLQETKEPFMAGLDTTADCLAILPELFQRLGVNREALLAGFTPSVFATDRALELVADGMPFRDAYQYVKDHLDELENSNPDQALARKKHLGAPAGLDFTWLLNEANQATAFVNSERRRLAEVVNKLRT